MFDPGRLILLDANKEQAGVQAEAGAWSKDGLGLVAVNAATPSQGEYRFAAVRLPSAQGVWGDGRLIRVWFQARDTGEPQIRLVDALVLTDEAR
jgi:hypothetical protein